MEKKISNFLNEVRLFNTEISSHFCFPTWIIINGSDWRVRYAQILCDLNHTCWMSLADTRTKQMKTLLPRMFKADSLFQVRSAKLRMCVSLTRHPHYLRAWNSLKAEGARVQLFKKVGIALCLVYNYCISTVSTNHSRFSLSCKTISDEGCYFVLTPWAVVKPSEMFRIRNLTFLASFKSLQIKWTFAFPERKFDLIGHNKRYLQMLSHRSELSILQARGVL